MPSSSLVKPFSLPGALTLALAAMSLLPRIASNPVLKTSFLLAAACLAVWQIVLVMRLSRARAAGAAVERIVRVTLRPQHYVQAAVQLSVYVYWGLHWRPVYDHAWLIVGQLLFAYALDVLLTWSRRDTYVLGFGAFPIVFSTNLFLWFRDDWFHLQFLMIAVGILGKEFVRWQRDGVSTHIFNPSAFTLSVFSIALIATGTTDITWGHDIASKLTLAPHIYLYLFSVGLVVMYFFGTTPVTATASAVLFGLSWLYAAGTGVPYFIDSEIPAAVFLGLHLLVTDPSTSPRTPTGKVLFGALYGIGVFGLYALLGTIGAPTFYDKLLCVPLLNLSVRGIDRLARSLESLRLGPNLAHMAIWIVFFLTMTALGRTDGLHPGDRLPFWQQACADQRPGACADLLQLEASYCGDNSAWACNELGVHYATTAPADTPRALTLFSKACELRFAAGCANVLYPAGASRAPPRALDLRLLLRERGKNLLDMPEADLYARACRHGWNFACAQVANTR